LRAASTTTNSRRLRALRFNAGNFHRVVRVSVGSDKLRLMATKPREVPCDEVIDRIDELLAWLVTRKLATRRDSTLAAAFRVLGGPRAEGSCERAVAECLYELETFLVAAQRRDSPPKLREEPRTEVERSLLYNDGPEAEADKALRAFAPKLQHLKKLIKRVAVRKVERAKLKGFNAEVVRATRAETKLLALGAVARVERVREDLQLVLEIFEAMCPALPEHELTLSGWRKLDGSVRKRLHAAGYNAEREKRSAR
jgi:hypothetical protein